jgi:hypothetical protein
MSIEGQRGSIPTGVYNGFSAPVRTLRHGAVSRAGRILMGGVAAAGVLGVAFGFLAKPDVRDSEGLGLKADEMVQIEVGPGRAPIPSSAVAAGGPLQTLPAGTSVPTVVVTRGPEPRAEPARREQPPKSAPAPDLEAAEPLPEATFAANELGDEVEAIVIPPPAFADAE